MLVVKILDISKKQSQKKGKTSAFSMNQLGLLTEMEKENVLKGNLSTIHQQTGTIRQFLDL